MNFGELFEYTKRTIDCGDARTSSTSNISKRQESWRTLGKGVVQPAFTLGYRTILLIDPNLTQIRLIVPPTSPDRA